jgi:hypothetical protein
MSQSQLRRLAHPGFRSLARLVVAAIASVALGTASTSFADVQRMDLDSDGVADVIERSSNPPAASLWLSTRGPMALGTGAVPARTADLHVTSPFASLGSFGDRIWYSSDANAGCGERISFLTGIQVGNDTDAVELVYCLDGGELLGGFIWADAGDLLGAATPSGGAREFTVDGASVSLEQAMAAQAANSGPSSSGGGICTRICWINATTGESDCGPWTCSGGGSGSPGSPGTNPDPPSSGDPPGDGLAGR